MLQDAVEKAGQVRSAEQNPFNLDSRSKSSLMRVGVYHVAEERAVREIQFDQSTGSIVDGEQDA